MIKNTEQKYNMQEELGNKWEEKIKRYETLLEMANDSILFVNLQGQIIDANKAALKMYGYSKEELIKKDIYDIRKNHDVKKIDAQMFKADKEGILFESIHYKKDGTPIFVEVSSCGTSLKGETVLLSIIRNISERKQAEEAVQKSKEKMEQAVIIMEKAKKEAETINQAKSEFLANMSHEIRTPLNGMIGMIQLTLCTNLTEEQKENLTIAKTCANSLLKIINDILDFSKIEAGKLIIEKTNFDIRQLIEDLIKVHSFRAKGKGLGLEYKISQKISQYINGDPIRIRQVLDNLIGNAIKFTAKGKVLVSVEEDLIGLKFSVADTGVGIEENKKQLLFKSFSQIDGTYTKKYGGTGLGLAISKQLVEMMGGTIWEESEKGIGSTFYFTIKFDIGKQVIVEIVGSDLGYKKNTSLKILAFEDDEINQYVLCRMLQVKGHQVAVANNGVKGLELLKDNYFDCIFMDIQMPEMDGIEATTLIRKNKIGVNKNIPIIAITAYSLKGDREKFLSYGMDEYISKPFQINELYEILAKVMIKNKEVRV